MDIFLLRGRARPQILPIKIIPEKKECQFKKTTGKTIFFPNLKHDKSLFPHTYDIGQETYFQSHMFFPMTKKGRRGDAK